MNLLSRFSEKLFQLTPNKSEIFPYIIIGGAFIAMTCFLMFNGWDAFIFSLGLVVFSSFFISSSLGKTERHQEKILSQKEDYIHLIQTELDAIWFVVEEGTCQYVSPSVEAILGYNEKSFRQGFSKPMIHPEDRSLFQSFIQMEQPKLNFNKKFEIRVLHKNGDYKLLELSGKIRFCKQGNKPHLICSLSKKDAVQKLPIPTQKPNEVAQTKSNDLSQASLTGLIAAHDLKEPLRTINSYARLLNTRKAQMLDEEGQEFLRFIVDGASRMEELIKDIQDLSKLDKTKLNREWVNPKAIFLDVEKGLRQKIEQTNTQINYEAMPAIEADAQQLKHVFQNILENSMKYCRNKTPEINVACEEQEDCWLFSLKDNGIGMEPAFLQDIFSPFRRLHGKGEFEGTGIGLAICKKIVDNHQGVIWAESDGLELGSSFYISIPKTLHHSRANDAPKLKSQKSIFAKTKSLFSDTAAMFL